MPGINLGGANFTRGAAIPLDDTMTTATTTTRDAIVSGVRFQGMCVFVIADTKTYQLKAGILNTDWVEYGGAAPAVDLKTDLFTAAGSASVTLTAVPGAKTNLFVSIQGVTQNDASYSVAGAVLTFDTIPPTGSLIQVKYGAQLAIGTPSDGTVTTLKIVDGSITQLKLAPKTASATSTAALGEVARSALCTSYSNTTITLTDVTNLSVTLTTNGRAVVLMLLADGIGSVYLVRSNALHTAQIDFVRAATTITSHSLQIGATGATGVSAELPLSSFSYMDFPAAGTYTYKVQAKVGNSAASAQITINNARLIAYEI